MRLESRDFCMKLGEMLKALHYYKCYYFYYVGPYVTSFYYRQLLHATPKQFATQNCNLVREAKKL